MGGQQKSDAWDLALAQGARIEVTACGHHVVAKDYAVIDRVMDQHICNLILEEAVVIETDFGRRSITAGGALWIEPGVRHTFRLLDPTRPYAMLNLRFQVWSGRRALGHGRGVLAVDDAWDLRHLWELVIDDRQRQRADRGERFRHMLALLYGDLRRRADGEDSAGGLGRHRRLVLLNWVAKHLHLRPSPSELAAVVGLSSDWFRRAFHASFGCSPRAWLVRERVRRAAQRLADEPAISIAEVAAQLGYEDYRLLDRQFRAELGVSPVQWRNR
jgi:AraC-like DNA-binding protein